MGKSESKVKAMPAAAEEPSQGSPELNEDEKSKDAFFVQIGEIAEAMIARHGRDFAIGTMILSARFIAEGKPLINRADEDKASINTTRPA